MTERCEELFSGLLPGSLESCSSIGLLLLGGRITRRAWDSPYQIEEKLKVTVSINKFTITVKSCKTLNKNCVFVFVLFLKHFCTVFYGS